MRTFIIFLTAAALAKIQIKVYHRDGSSNAFDATPGVCKVLNGAPINNISIPPGLVVKFFEDEGCKGDQLGFGFKEYFHLYESENKTKSVKVLIGPDQKPNSPVYYDDTEVGGNYNYGNNYYSPFLVQYGKFNPPMYYKSDILNLYNQLLSKHQINNLV